MCLIVGRRESCYHLIRQPVQSGGGGAEVCVFVDVGLEGISFIKWGFFVISTGAAVNQFAFTLGPVYAKLVFIETAAFLLGSSHSLHVSGERSL